MYQILEEGQCLRVDGGSEVPCVCEQTSKANIYIPSIQLGPADCLNDAEQIMAAFANVELPEDSVNSEASDYDASDGSNGYIGDTDEDNFRVVQAIPLHLSNGNVNPNVGEAYFIYDTNQTEDSAPYHAAAVIAKDTTYNYTLETFSGGDGYEFRRYQINGSNNFHNYWNRQYFRSNGKTIRIKLK